MGRELFEQVKTVAQEISNSNKMEKVELGNEINGLKDNIGHNDSIVKSNKNIRTLTEPLRVENRNFKTELRQAHLKYSNINKQEVHIGKQLKLRNSLAKESSQLRSKVEEFSKEAKKLDTNNSKSLEASINKIEKLRGEVKSKLHDFSNVKERFIKETRRVDEPKLTRATGEYIKSEVNSIRKVIETTLDIDINKKNPPKINDIVLISTDKIVKEAKLITSIAEKNATTKILKEFSNLPMSKNIKKIQNNKIREIKHLKSNISSLNNKLNPAHNKKTKENSLEIQREMR